MKTYTDAVSLLFSGTSLISGVGLQSGNDHIISETNIYIDCRERESDSYPNYGLWNCYVSQVARYSANTVHYLQYSLKLQMEVCDALTPTQAQETLANETRPYLADHRQVGLPRLRQNPAEGGQEKEMQKGCGHGAQRLSD